MERQYLRTFTLSVASGGTSFEDSPVVERYECTWDRNVRRAVYPLTKLPLPQTKSLTQTNNRRWSSCVRSPGVPRTPSR